MSENPPLIPLADYLTPLVCGPSIEVPRGRKRAHGVATVKERQNERQRKHRADAFEDKARRVCVLDMETDPFDNVERSRIDPFACCLYSDDFEPVIIWETNREKFVHKVMAAINALPGKYLIYAHNGGRFDFMFLISELRGTVSFKGRGIMSARVGAHELRDSFHIIPEKLAAVQKDAFDYSKMKKGNREKHKAEIIKYMVNDCRYLLPVIQDFITRFGFKLSIGQAAMHEMKQHYTIKKFTKGWDAYCRHYFFGGRVECLEGRGHWKADKRGTFKLYDVNSMYPHVMASYEHPVGGFHDYQIRPGKPNKHTCFIKLRCDNRGALVSRTFEGSSCTQARGEFFTTIWEYEVALKYKLISNVQIKYCIDCTDRSNFSKFIVPLYDNRLKTKTELARMKAAGLQHTEAFITTQRDDIFYKLLMNNAYGKLAQNPRNFKEHYLTDPDAMPPDQFFQSVCLMLPRETSDFEERWQWSEDGADEKKQLLNPPPSWYDYLTQELSKDENLSDEFSDYTCPHFEHSRYRIWQKPSPGFRFNNVGTAASITGASRAVLLEAMQHADTPIYCDTDSIIARSIDDTKVCIDKTKLGAWGIEDEYSEVIICGKKTYGCKIAGKENETKIRSKGINRDPKSGGLTWEMLERVLKGGIETVWNNAPTFNRYSEQDYIARRVKATAPLKARKAI